jgi:hypothetical protein
VQVRDYGRELNHGVLQELLGPRLLPGALLGQVPAVAGEGAEPADLLGGHEALGRHAPLGHLCQPGAISFVGFRPAGEGFDLFRVEQLAGKALGLQDAPMSSRRPQFLGG